MGTVDSRARKIKTQRRLIFWSLFFLFVFLFRYEVFITLKVCVLFLLTIPQKGFSLLNNEVRVEILKSIDPNNEFSNAVKIVGNNVFIYLSILLFSLFNIAQLALPVRTWDERKKAFERILLFALGKHGPAVFVREGKIVASQKEMKNTQPGVALVDLASSIVLEQQESTGIWKELERQQQEIPIFREGQKKLPGIQKLLERNQEKIRVFGPGVVFTKKGEKIHSVIDIRKQVRSKGNAQSFTRDGVELENPVFVVFDLSGTPDVISVAYIGGSEKQNLYGVDVTEENNTAMITSYYKLDATDEEEIHQFAQYGVFPTKEKKTFDDSPLPEVIFKTPFSFDRERVFAAAFAEAHISGDSTSWDELPLRVTLDIFQKEMEKYYIDDIFQANSPKAHLLPSIKARLGRKVKFQGMLSYRVLKKTTNYSSEQTTWNEGPFHKEGIGEILESTHFKFSPIYELRTSKVLRDRGIKVIVAGFPELRIADNALKEKFSESWKARWKKEVDIITAEHELEARREIDRARAQTQKELTYLRADLFQKTEYTTEALALQLFQALERAATSGGLRSRDALSMVQSLFRWLLIQRKNFEKKSGPNKRHWVGKTRPSDKPPASDTQGHGKENKDNKADSHGERKE